MPTSLFDRLGLGCARALANAEHEMRRPVMEARLVAELAARVERRNAQQLGSFGASLPHSHCSETLSAPASWHRWVVTFTAAEVPSHIDGACAALMELGIRILDNGSVDGESEQNITNGLTLALPPWLDVPAVEFALVRAGGRNVRARRLVNGR